MFQASSWQNRFIYNSASWILFRHTSHTGKSTSGKVSPVEEKEITYLGNMQVEKALDIRCLDDFWLNMNE